MIFHLFFLRMIKALTEISLYLKVDGMKGDGNTFREKLVYNIQHVPNNWLITLRRFALNLLQSCIPSLFYSGYRNQFNLRCTGSQTPQFCCTARQSRAVFSSGYQPLISD